MSVMIYDPLGLGARVNRNVPEMNPISTEDDESMEYSKSLNMYPKSDKTLEEIKQLLLTSESMASIDADVVLKIDSSTTFKIFIDEKTKEIYTREDLCNKFAFIEMKVEPEVIFKQQEVIVLKYTGERKYEEQIQYYLNDIGGEFVLFRKQDFELLNRVKTKIFIGKKEWKEFKKIQNMYKTMIHIKQNRLEGIEYNPLSLTF